MVGFVGESFEKRQWESEQFHLGWMYEIVGTYWDKSRRKAGLFPSFLRYLRCQWIRTSWHWPAAMTRPRRPHQQTLVSWSVWLGKLPVCHRISLHSAWFMNDVYLLGKNPYEWYQHSSPDFLSFDGWKRRDSKNWCCQNSWTQILVSMWSTREIVNQKETDVRGALWKEPNQAPKYLESIWKHLVKNQGHQWRFVLIFKGSSASLFNPSC